MDVKSSEDHIKNNSKIKKRHSIPLSKKQSSPNVTFFELSTRTELERDWNIYDWLRQEKLREMKKKYITEIEWNDERILFTSRVAWKKI
jgi:hypothetical protein